MKAKIALGLGDNTDYEIVWNSALLEKLIRQYAIRQSELETNLDVATDINSERELVISILSFLNAGRGGERWVASSELVEAFARRFEMKITLGGTSVRSAIAMRKLGYISALHLVTINEHVRRLIPQDSPYVCSNSQESSHPHLIVQFDTGTRVQAGDIDICASRANRIIYHNDADNITMELNEAYGDLVSEAKVFLISGFNAMHDKELLTLRLASLLRIMAKLPQDALVYYEDAGFHKPSFNQLIHATLANRISIFSLNEDELQAHLGRKLDLLDAGQVAQALIDLQKIIHAPITVVHSMYWALAYGEKAASVANALKGGVTMATTRFRYGDDFTVANYHEIEALAPNPQGATFAAAIHSLLGANVCCVPVAHVEQSNATTIGLGDAFVGGFLPALL